MSFLIWSLISRIYNIKDPKYLLFLFFSNLKHVFMVVNIKNSIFKFLAVSTVLQN